MEPISIVKGIATVIVAESSLFSWCNGIDSGVAIVAIFASLILWFLSKLDNDIKSLANKLESDSKSNNLKFDKQIYESNKRFDKIHGIILDIVLDKKKRKKKKDPKTDP